DALGPDILPVAIDLGDAGIPPAGGQHAAVGQPRGVRRVRSVGLPGDFAGPVHFDDLVVVVLGDQHISAGKELSVAPRSQPAYLHGTEALARGIHLDPVAAALAIKDFAILALVSAPNAAVGSGNAQNHVVIACHFDDLIHRCNQGVAVGEPLAADGIA